MTAQTAELDAAHDVVEFLIGQHMQIRDLFTEVQTSTGHARANTVAGPVMSLFDRTKDIVRKAMSGNRQWRGVLLPVGAET